MCTTDKAAMVLAKATEKEAPKMAPILLVELLSVSLRPNFTLVSNEITLKNRIMSKKM